MEKGSIDEAITDQVSIPFRANPWLHTLTIVIFIAVLFTAMKVIRSFSDVWFASVWGYWSLLFAAFAFAAFAYYFACSLLTQIVTETAQILPDWDGRNLWHSRWALRLNAISQLGYVLIFLACGWMYPDINCVLWDYFGILLGTGLVIKLACDLVVWFRHPPLRPSMTQAWAITSIVLFVAIIAIIAASATRPFYLDAIAMLLMISVASIFAQFWISISAGFKLQKAMIAADYDV